MFEKNIFTAYYIDKLIWSQLEKSLVNYKKILIITGEKSFNSVRNNLLKVLKEKEIFIEKYGNECSYENVNRILSSVKEKEFDLILGIGGGKAIDTAKLVAFKLKKDIFTIPTIASTCAGTSALSVVYNSDKTFKEIYLYENPPKKIFIDLETIKKSPVKYIWAGMGDTLAKFYEVRIKKEYMEKNKMFINFSSSMGINLSSGCRDLILKNGEKAYFDKEINEEFKKIVLTIIVNTGMVSNLVDEFLNGGIAHSVFYGLTILPRIEEEHLHGEVVSFGILVQLLLENKIEEYKSLLEFYKKLKFPKKLTDVVVMEEFLEKEDKIIEEILNGPDLINFNFDMKNLKEILLQLG